MADVFTREVLHLPKGVRVGGFKEIRFHTQPTLFRPCMQFIRTFFPKARFVFNTRSHAAVAKSGWWADMHEARVYQAVSYTHLDVYKRQPSMSCNPQWAGPFGSGRNGKNPISAPISLSLIHI